MTGMPTHFPQVLYDPAAIAAEAALFADGARTALVAPVLLLARRQRQAISLSLAATFAADAACLAPLMVGRWRETMLIAGEALAATLMLAALTLFAMARLARTLMQDVRNEKRRIMSEEFELKRAVAAQQLRSLDNAECEAGLRELGQIWASLQSTNRLLQIQTYELSKDLRKDSRLSQLVLTALTAAGCLTVGFAFDPHQLSLAATSAIGVIICSGLGRQLQLWSRAHGAVLIDLLQPLPPAQLAAADPLAPVAEWIDEVLTQRNEHEAFFRRPNGRALWQAGGQTLAGLPAGG